jgi:hypothetical protein
MIVADSANITKKAAEQISRRALELANDRGYCYEVENMLTDLGFPIPDSKATVTLTVEVKVPRDADEFDIENALDLKVKQFFEDYSILSEDVAVSR